jgi:hypothetical protein
MVVPQPEAVMMIASSPLAVDLAGPGIDIPRAASSASCSRPM